MMIVRFPNGQAVRYNTANYLYRQENLGWVLKESENGKNIAFIQLSAGAIVEFQPACAAWNGLTEKSLGELTKQVELLRRKIRKPKK